MTAAAPIAGRIADVRTVRRLRQHHRPVLRRPRPRRRRLAPRRPRRRTSCSSSSARRLLPARLHRQGRRRTRAASTARRQRRRHRRHRARGDQPARHRHASTQASRPPSPRPSTWLLDHPAGPTASFGGGASPRRPTPTAPAWPAGRSARPTTPRRDAGRGLGARASRSPNLRRLRALGAERRGASPTTSRAVAAARRTGSRPTTSDQWRRATAQALPGLALAPAATSDRRRHGPAGFGQAGTDARGHGHRRRAGRRRVRKPRGTRRVHGAANAAGRSPVVDAARAATATRTVSAVRRGHERHRAVTTCSASLRVPFTLKPSVAHGKQQVVKVSGLEPGEAVRVTFRRRQGRQRRANGQGSSTPSFAGDRQGRPGARSRSIGAVPDPPTAARRSWSTGLTMRPRTPLARLVAAVAPDRGGGRRRCPPLRPRPRPARGPTG